MERKFKYRVNLDTKTEIMNFVKAAELFPHYVMLENENGTKRGNAKTLLNVIDTITWDKVYIISDFDIYRTFQNFIIEET